MTDNTELKRAASASKNWGGEVGEGRWYAAECFKRPYFSAQDAEFIAACDPGRVLTLIAENEQLAKTADCRDRLNVQNKALSDSFRAERNALAGVLQRFVDGEHDHEENQAERHMYFTEAQSLLALVNGELEAHTIVPDSAIKAIHAERDQLRAEIAGLRTGYEAYERVNAELKAECEVLRKDDLRAGLMALAAYIGPICTEAVFAAMGKGEQS